MERQLKKAVALKYINDLPAPFIIAKGRDELAEKILAIAAENDIHILEKADLTDRLYMADIGSFIPEEVYGIVAEVLVFVYTIHNRTGKK